eukprot:scaffold6231_cov108-Cylindrotheca_fusiformis.AAC.6
MKSIIVSCKVHCNIRSIINLRMPPKRTVIDQPRMSRVFPSYDMMLGSVSKSNHVSRERIQRKNASVVAKSMYLDNISRSKVIQSETLAEIPRFASIEIQMGLVLGSGNFACVYEVRGFFIQQQQQHQEEADDDDYEDDEEVESRNFIAKYCYRSNGDARYAVKRLKRSVVKESSLSFLNGMDDLATETLFLSSLEHPNIIKLRGMAQENMFSENFFLVLDRLYDSLAARLPKWKKQEKMLQGILGIFIKDHNGEEKKRLFEERMQYGLDLASAIAYIHEHRIIHRDLKPENIGFDVRGDIKIFDFGLAKEMPQQEDRSRDETYLFTASTGTPRYMAPEVAVGRQYNQSCDIYSFGLVFWEMITLKRPFSDQKSLEDFTNKVWSESGPRVRPPLPKKLLRGAPNLSIALKRSWDSTLQKRPTAQQLESVLRGECLTLRKDMRVSHNTRRSTYVLIRGG